MEWLSVLILLYAIDLSEHQKIYIGLKRLFIDQFQIEKLSQCIMMKSYEKQKYKKHS